MRIGHGLTSRLLADLAERLAALDPSGYGGFKAGGDFEVTRRALPNVQHTPAQLRHTVQVCKEEFKIVSAFGGVFRKAKAA